MPVQARGDVDNLDHAVAGHAGEAECGRISAASPCRREAQSVVSAPCVADGRVVGTLGVIGPTRMAYDRMIQIVDITSRLVGHALSAPR